jgi:hypothetical protein
MLKEISRYANYGGVANRRAFTDTDMDLYIWFKGGEPERFHLSYNKQSCTQSVSWNNESGFELNQPDLGEAIAILFGLLDSYAISSTSPMQLALQFLHASDPIEPWLADFIYARLLEHPGHNAAHVNQDRVLRSF